MLAGQLALLACSEGEPDTNPVSSGGGAGQSGAGSGQGGKGATAGMNQGGAGRGGLAGKGGATGSPGGAGQGGMAGAPRGGAGAASGGATAGIAGAQGGEPAAAGAGMGGRAPTGDAGMSGRPATGGSGSEPLSFEADIWPMFAELRDPVFVYHDGSTYESCVTTGVCHGGLNPGAGLRMPDATTAYGMLLDIPSASALCADTIRVVAGKPDESCLVLFYEGRLQGELDWVDDAEIDRVKQWILDGALP